MQKPPVRGVDRQHAAAGDGARVDGRDRALWTGGRRTCPPSRRATSGDVRGIDLGGGALADEVHAYRPDRWRENRLRRQEGERLRRRGGDLQRVRIFLIENGRRAADCRAQEQRQRGEERSASSGAGGLEQGELARALEGLDARLARERGRAREAFLGVDQLHGAARARVGGAAAGVVRGQPRAHVLRDAGVQASIDAAGHVDGPLLRELQAIHPTAKAYNPGMDFSREWTAFGGASLALMGAAIGAGARRHAEDNLAWRREWRIGPTGPRTPDPSKAGASFSSFAPAAL